MDDGRDMLDELDIAIARAEGHAAGLREAQSLINGQPISRQHAVVITAVEEETYHEVERLPRAIESKPERKPSAKRRVGEDDNANRLRIAELLFKDGPMSVSKVSRKLDRNPSEFIVKRLVSEHPWFEYEAGRVSLTTEGHQSIKGTQDGEA